MLKVLLLLLSICSLSFASVMQRGAGTNNNVSISSPDKLTPILNVPLPSANTNYYYSYESNENAYKNLPIKVVNKIIAFVNKGVITEIKVEEKVQEILLSFKQKGITPPNITDIRSKVVEQLIMQKIQLDLAKRLGIKINDLDVVEAINNIASQNNMGIEEFKSSLKKQGIDFHDFRKQISEQIITERLKQREVDARVIVSEDEVNRVLNSETYRNRIDYNLSDIVVAIPEQATMEVIEQKQNLANMAYNELKSGVPFYQVAAKYSNAPNALTGGELGWRTNAAMPASVLSRLKKIAPLEYTEVIHLPVGFFIFKINEVKEHGAPQIVHQYHVRHILVKVNEVTGDEEAHQKILGIKRVLDHDINDLPKKNLDFINLAKQYSQDSSSIKGGDIGWVAKGDTVLPFERTMVSLPIGVVSEPIRSVFGWHVLEVLETRDSNLTNDREKAGIREELHLIKSNMLYTQWLRDIREMSYIKMNDN